MHRAHSDNLLQHAQVCDDTCLGRCVSASTSTHDDTVHAKTWLETVLAPTQVWRDHGALECEHYVLIQQSTDMLNG